MVLLPLPLPFQICFPGSLHPAFPGLCNQPASLGQRSLCRSAGKLLLCRAPEPGAQRTSVVVPLSPCGSRLGARCRLPSEVQPPARQRSFSFPHTSHFPRGTADQQPACAARALRGILDPISVARISIFSSKVPSEKVVTHVFDCATDGLDILDNQHFRPK